MGRFDNAEGEQVGRAAIERDLLRPVTFRTHFIRRPNQLRFRLREKEPDPAKAKDWTFGTLRGWLIGEGSVRDEAGFVAVAIYLSEGGWFMASVEAGPLENWDSWSGRLYSDFRGGGPFHTPTELLAWLRDNCFYEQKAVEAAWTVAAETYRGMGA